MHYIYLSTHLRIDTYIHTYIHAYLPTYIHTCVHTYIHTYIHTYTCIIHTYVYTYIHMHIITANIHVRILTCLSMSPNQLRSDEARICCVLSHGCLHAPSILEYQALSYPGCRAKTKQQIDIAARISLTGVQLQEYPTYTYARTLARTHASLYVCVCVCVYVCMYVCVYVCMYVCKHTITHVPL